MPKLHCTSAGGTIHYRQIGQARPAIMLVHGAGGSCRHFSELHGVLGRRHRTVAIDLPGHGASEPFDGLEQEHAARPRLPALLERYRDVVAELAERIGLGRFVLVGHSMGGAVAQLFALRYSDRLSAAVLVATAGRLRVSASFFAALQRPPSAVNELFAAMAYSAAHPRSLVQRWVAEQVACDVETLLADFEACNAFDVRDQLEHLDCPTTVVSGLDDLITPPKLQRRLSELIDGSTLVAVARAGHFVLRERPDRAAEIILAAAART